MIVRSQVFFFVVLAFAFGKITFAANVPPIGATLIPHGTIFKSFADYEETVSIDPDHYHGQKITSAEVEIRFPQENLRVIRFPYIWMLNASVALDDQRPVKTSNAERDDLGDNHLRRMGSPRPGSYQVAFLLNGIRASNVISIQIDPQFDSTKAPVLELVTLESNPFQERAQLLALARGPTPFDPHLIFSADFCSSPLLVDGVERTGGRTAWDGPESPIRSGTVCWFFPELGSYTPPIAPDKPHTISIKSGKYESALLHFDPLEIKLNQAWDAATPGIKDQPSNLPVRLEGTVRDDQGKPLPVCEVRLGQPQQYSTLRTPPSIEYTDQNGHYQFVGVPPGTYRVVCRNLSNRDGNSSLAKEKTITLTGSETTLLDILFSK